MFDRIESRPTQPRRLAILLPILTAGLMSMGARAQIINQQSMSDATKDLVRPVIRLLKAAMKPCLTSELSSLFGSGFEQVEYEDAYGGRSATLEDALDHLMSMLDNDSLRLENMDSRGSTYLADGTKADVITFDDEYIERIINGTSSRSKMFWKIALGATLVNEITHVFQIPSSLDAVNCDAERDSDAASIKFLCAILDALSDGGGSPHTSLIAIDIDDEAIAGLGDMLANCGINTATQIAELHEDVKARKMSYVKRKADIFDANINASTSWGRAYYGPSYNGNHDKYVAKAPNRSAATVESDDGATSGTFAPPGGELVVQSTLILPPDDQLVLIEATHAAGQNRLRFWKDGDGDGLPEPIEAVLPVLLSGSSDPGLDGMAILPVFPTALGLSGQNDGLMVHNRLTGEVVVLELQANGLPAGPPLVLFQDPLLTDMSGFIYFNSVTEPTPGDLAFVFSDRPNVAQFGHVPSVAIVVQNANPLTGGIASPPVVDTLASNLQAAPIPPGVATFFPGIGALNLFGDPGSLLVLEQRDAPVATSVASGIAAPSGIAPWLFPSLPVIEGHLYRVNDGSQGREYFAHHGDGHHVDHVVLDDGGDPTVERIDLVRLVGDGFTGGRLYLGAENGGLLQPAYEMVLEEPPLYIQSWGPTGRLITLDDGNTLDLTVLPGSNPPLYVQSIVDLDGDSVADESLIIRRQAGNPGFFVEILGQVGSSPTVTQNIGLPPTVELASFVVDDFDLDGDFDICIRALAVDDVNLRLVNDGSGNFQLSTTPIHPGTGEDFEMDVRVDEEALPCPGIAVVVPGQDLNIDIFSENGTFDGLRYFAVGQFFNTGFPPPGLPSFGLTFNPGGIPAPFFLIDPTGSPSLLGPPLLPPGGSQFLLPVPPGLSGLNLMTQALVLTPMAGNGFFATSSGTEIRFN